MKNIAIVFSKNLNGIEGDELERIYECNSEKLYQLFKEYAPIGVVKKLVNKLSKELNKLIWRRLMESLKLLIKNLLKELKVILGRRRAIKDSISHWEHMIEFAKAQLPESRVHMCDMEAVIEKNWHGRSCPLCTLYYLSYSSCRKCPISKKSTPCGHSGSVWRLVNRSEIWGEWITYAIEMLALLRSLK